MSIILQPKRWQKADHPRYDPIRHHPWFNRLQKRKHIIPMMEGCLSELSEACVLTQEELCDLWNVSPREFRDYLAFVRMERFEQSPTFQSILDSAYNAYCSHDAIRPIQRFIADFAPLYGVNYRHVWEKWEVDAHFYPIGYQYEKR